MADSTGILQPYPVLFDKSGQPLDAGYVYVGQYGLNPETSQINVYWDADLTQPAPQPIRTINGYYSRNGTPAKIFIDGAACSISVRDKSQSLVFNDLFSSGQVVANGLPASLVMYGSITQKDFNDGVESITELLAIQNPFDGMRVYVNGLQQGWFIYDSARSSENDGGLVFDGWVREYVLFATPKMFGITPNDSTGSYGTKLNSLFNCGFPILLGKEKYYSDTPIIINNKNLSLQGISKLESRIVFKNSGHGIVQNTNTSTHVFSIHDCSITTSQNGTGNGSGFKYDASSYISTLSVTGTGYKVLGNRTLNRGQISNVDFGSSDDSESSKGWKHALEFLGAMNFSVNGLHMRLPTDRSGNGCWIHGDGMLTDIHFNDVFSFWGDKVFRMNDYVEGFHLTNFELVNCNDGIFNEADADTTVSAPVKMLSSYIGLGHILGYRNCISSTWMSSAKLTGLELYVWSDNTLHPVSQGINVVTCDGVLITGSTVVNANPAANGTTIGVQLGTGWGNTVSECLFKGESWYAAVALGTNNSFYNNTIRGVTVDKSQNAILVNETNCYENTIESPSIVTSTGQSISTSANVLSKNNVILRKSLFNANYAHTANTTFTVDISSSGFTQVPISIEVSEVAGVFGGIQYSYRRDVSTSTQITIETTALISTPSASNRALFVNVFGV